MPLYTHIADLAGNTELVGISVQWSVWHVRSIIALKKNQAGEDSWEGRAPGAKRIHRR